MSNAFTQDPAINGGQVITPTGFSKFNAKNDGEEWKNRKIGSTVADTQVANIYQRELLFQRVGRLPKRTTDIDVPVTEVFAAFNGIQPGSEAQFRFVGLACNPPEHMNRVGPLTGHFAVYADGGNTIKCRSHLPIPQGALLKWCIPSRVGLPMDEKEHGRVLPEIAAYNPTETQLSSLKIHTAQHRLVHKKPVEDRAQSELALKIMEELQSIAYLAVLAYLEAIGLPADDTEKLRIARIFTVSTSKSGDANSQSQRDRLRTLLPDKLFQMKYEQNNDKSLPNDAQRPFPLQPIFSANQNGEKLEIARRTADPFGRIISLMMKQTEEDLRQVIGFTNSGGVPGYEMDVVLRRI